LIDPRTPCVIGVAQRTVRPLDGPSPEPLDLWEQVCRAAVADSGAAGDVLAAVDLLSVVFCQSWPYDDPAGRLAVRLGASRARRVYSGLGGTVPQQLVTAAVEEILDGRCDVAVIAGAEALATVRQAKKDERRLSWSHRRPGKAAFPFEAPFHPAEVAHQVFQAFLTFALRDVARRAQRGVTPAAYRAGLVALWAPFTEVAEANPYSWFPARRGAAEIAAPGPANRMVAYPYTKYMTAVMDVDMAAAVIVASTAKADELGVPHSQRVYPRGWAYGTDPVYVAEHDCLASSPAMAAAFTEALAAAGVGADDVAHLDLYSCFGSSVNFARDALGIQPEDSRPLTVTGGLPYHGGPGSNFMTHSIASMVTALRADPGTYGMVTGVGMHMTKHVAAVYSGVPGPLRPPAPDLQARLDAGPRRLIRDVASGPATVATYSVVHDRDGSPAWGVAVCDLPEGDRCYVRIDDPAVLTQVEEREWVGEPVTVSPAGGGVNLATPA